MPNNNAKLSQSGELLKSEVTRIVNEFSQNLRVNNMTDANLVNELEVVTAKFLALKTNQHLIHTYSKILDN